MYVDFVSPYKITPRIKKQVFQKHLRFEHTYLFKNKFGNKYVVTCHQYDYNFYAIKFHLKKHTNTKNMYRLLTNQFDAIRILNTVVGVMVHLKKYDNSASFGFIGMPSVEEEVSNTKRFRLYARISKKYFSPDNFIHIENAEKSSYLIIDKKANHKSIISKINEVLEEEFNKDSL